MFAQAADQLVQVTLYTDSHIVRGTVRTHQRRISDILNRAEEPYIVMANVSMDDWGSRAQPMRAEYAQVNLGAVLFAVGDTAVEPTPELRTVKISEQAFISVPPFKIVGKIYLLPERDLREALGELTGAFIPVTEASFWSDTVGEARQSAMMVAFNHTRAQILAPHREVDPWEGLSRAPEPATSEAADGGWG
ncbi:MAG TPA: hypothetical protein VEO91_11210 [Candidatus Limnocylindria bacterium]|nr:hypothetical protein [Candidatus Limnocylindria bacterium]